MSLYEQLKHVIHNEQGNDLSWGVVKSVKDNVATVAVKNSGDVDLEIPAGLTLTRNARVTLVRDPETRNWTISAARQVQRITGGAGSSKGYLGRAVRSTQFQSSSTSWVDVSGLSVTVDTDGPVLIVVTAILSSTPNSANLTIDIDGTNIGGTDGFVTPGPASFSYVAHDLAAGTHTFKVRGKTYGASTFTVGGSNSATGLRGLATLTIIQL